MIGVTIGVGEEHSFYANEASKRMRKYTGLETYVLTDEHLKEYGTHKIFKLASPDKCRCHYLKFFLWDIFPNEDEILYFDCDYCVLRPWEPHLYFKYGPWTRNWLMACRDRSEFLQPHKPNISTILHYFNAGFFIAKQEGHKELSEYCKSWPNRDVIQWNDQCIWNEAIVNRGDKISYLPRIFNSLDTGPALLDSNPFAIHSSGNYDHYRAGTQIQTSDQLEWNLTAMQGQAGLNVCYSEARPYSVYLLPDGTDSNGKIWFISKGWHYNCDARGSGLKMVEYKKISDE